MAKNGHTVRDAENNSWGGWGACLRNWTPLILPSSPTRVDETQTGEDGRNGGEGGGGVGVGNGELQQGIVESKFEFWD